MSEKIVSEIPDIHVRVGNQQILIILLLRKKIFLQLDTGNLT